ncbi:MAG: TonB-dependent receptor, partial [Veillonellales bacterium]
GMAYELGWKKEFTAKWNGRVTGFLNDIDDYVNVYSGSEIGSQPPTYNIDHAKIKGLEFATDYQFNQKAGAVFNVTTQTASKSGDQLDPDGTDLTNLPKQTVNFGLRYNNLQGFRSSLDTRYRKNKTLGNYAIVDFAMSYTKNNRTVALAVNNIFDKDYQQTAGFPMPGINYSLSYQIGF